MCNHNLTNGLPVCRKNAGHILRVQSLKIEKFSVGLYGKAGSVFNQIMRNELQRPIRQDQAFGNRMCDFLTESGQF